MRSLRGRRRQRGASAVEFALLLPILVMMLLGMIDFGMLTNANTVVASAARDGARAASLGSPESAVITVAQRTGNSLPGAAPTYNVCYFADYTTATAAGPCTAVGTYDGLKAVGGIVQVTVSYKYSYITPLTSWVGLANPATVTKSSYLRIETTS